MSYLSFKENAVNKLLQASEQSIPAFENVVIAPYLNVKSP